MRLSIRQKIMAIAVGLVVTMAVASVLSAMATVGLSRRLDSLRAQFIPAYAGLARADIRSMERAMILRRMVILKLRHPDDAAGIASLRALYDAKGQEMEHEAQSALAVLKSMEVARDGDPVALVAIETGLDNAMTGARRYLAQEVDVLWQALDTGDARGIDDSLARIDTFRDDLNRKLESIRNDMRSLLETSAAQAVDEARRAKLIAMILTGLATVIGLGVAFLLSANLARPVRRLLDGTRAIESGDLNQTLAITSSDEIGDLTSAFNRMAEQMRLKERLRETFGKFVDPRIVDSMISGAAGGPQAAQRETVTIFFSDIVGFTTISEQLTPAAVLKLLENYLSVVTQPIHQSNGILDKFTGDGVMAFWTPAFSETGNHAASACLAALRQQEAMAELNRLLPEILGLRRGAPALRIRMGMATGEAVVGTIGSATSKAFTVIGDPVNLASRLEGANKLYGTGIIVSEDTARLAGEAVECRELDRVAVVGRSEPVGIFEVMAPKGALPQTARELRTEFAAGLAAYRGRNWTAAAQAFRRCIEIVPGDGPSKLFVDRLRRLEASPPPDDWTGTWQLTEK